MRYLSAKRYRDWWRGKTAETARSTWGNKDKDCDLETKGRSLWDDIYKEHLEAYDTVRGLPSQMDRQLGIDCVALTRNGCRSIQEKVRSRNSYNDVGIESRKRDPDDPLGCAVLRLRRVRRRHGGVCQMDRHQLVSDGGHHQAARNPRYQRGRGRDAPVPRGRDRRQDPRRHHRPERLPGLINLSLPHRAPYWWIV